MSTHSYLDEPWRPVWSSSQWFKEVMRAMSSEVNGGKWRVGDDLLRILEPIQIFLLDTQILCSQQESPSVRSFLRGCNDFQTSFNKRDQCPIIIFRGIYHPPGKLPTKIADFKILFDEWNSLTKHKFWLLFCFSSTNYYWSLFVDWRTFCCHQCCHLQTIITSSCWDRLRVMICRL